MSPTTAAQRVVEYRFQCFCGAPIVSTELATSCVHCGKSLAIRRVKKQHWKIAPPELPHRRLRFADLRMLAMRISLLIALACGAYILAQGLYYWASYEDSDSAAVLE